MPFLLFGALILLAGLLSDIFIHEHSTDLPALCLFAVYVLSLALNNLIRGSTNLSNAHGNSLFFNHFSGFGPRLGLRIISVYTLAIGQILVDWLFLT